MTKLEEGEGTEGYGGKGAQKETKQEDQAKGKPRWLAAMNGAPKSEPVCADSQLSKFQELTTKGKDRDHQHTQLEHQKFIPESHLKSPTLLSFAIIALAKRQTLL